MNPPFTSLKKQVTCSICLDTYTEPKAISCFHTRVNQKQGKFRCPDCQAEIELPERKSLRSFAEQLFSLKSVRAPWSGRSRCHSKATTGHLLATFERKSTILLLLLWGVYFSNLRHWRPPRPFIWCAWKSSARGEEKHLIGCRDHQGKGKLVWSRVEIIRENISGCGIVYRNR